MAKNVIYAVSRVRAYEYTLLNAEKLNRLAEAGSGEEGLKILNEFNYGAGASAESPYDYEKLIDAETADAVSFVKDFSADIPEISLFLTKFDYHNAKAYMKAKYMRTDNLSGILEPSGNIPLSVLKDWIMSDDYSGVSAEMAEALDFIDSNFSSGRRSPKTVDSVLDKAYFKEIARRKKRFGKEIKNYFTDSADLTNISVILRCRNAGISLAGAMESLVEGGRLDAEALAALYDSGAENFAERFKYMPFAEVAEKSEEELLNGGFAKFEIERDRYLLSFFKPYAAECFSPSAVILFLLTKLAEADEIRLIMTCKNNGVSREILNGRLRRIYE